VHDRLEVPEPPVILVVVRVHNRFVELVVAAKVTVPVKPLSEETEIEEVPATLTAVVTDVGLLEIAKSCAWKVTVAE
jgi:hypothetical protein